MDKLDHIATSVFCGRHKDRPTSVGELVFMLFLLQDILIMFKEYIHVIHHSVSK